MNAFEYRLSAGMDFIKKRSHCPKCKKILKWYDLIPLLSFCLINGKCRYCGTRVSYQEPLIELFSGMLFLLSFWYIKSRMYIYGISDLFFVIIFSLLFGAILALFLFFALYDVKHKIVPNKVIIPVTIFTFIGNIILTAVMHLNICPICHTFFEDYNILWNIAGGLAGSLFIALIIIVTKGKGMGGGDLKLVFLMGLILGVKKLIIALYLAVLLGSVLGIIWGIKKGKIRGLKLPFALFLSIGTIISLMYGMDLWNWFGEVLFINY
jgi:leader peptidase (prepilin peptidase)/N-methyltransferase